MTWQGTADEDAKNPEADLDRLQPCAMQRPIHALPLRFLKIEEKFPAAIESHSPAMGQNRLYECRDIDRSQLH
jgi:hypothetical protein